MIITVPDCSCIEGALNNEQKLALQPIRNKKIKQIEKEFSGIWIFPKDSQRNGKSIENDYIIKDHNGKLSTSKLVGFVEHGGVQLKICSRFDVRENVANIYCSKDQFFMYMMSKVLSINIFDMDFASGGISAMNMLLLLFPYSLKKALAQGLYKEYQQFRHNDANVRGVIDINRHLRSNIPFAGRISYTTREHAYDNPITELIRHTVEFIGAKPMGRALLGQIREEVATIRQATPTYERGKRQSIINKNLRPKIHPYYSKYRTLQELCLRILRYESESYGDNNKQMKGVLFDAAWLWEEYLNTLLAPEGYNHPTNKDKKGGLHIFETPDVEDLFDRGNRRIFPDFYNKVQIMDAKYKLLESKTIEREDLYQIISYMHTMKIDHGGFICPGTKGGNRTKTYKLTGYGGLIYCVVMHIPQDIDNPGQFKDEISISERELIRNLRELTL